MVGFGFAAIVLAVYFGATLGVVTTLLALLLAALPLGIVIPTFLWLDRFEAEPTRYLVVAFLLGGAGRRPGRRSLQHRRQYRVRVGHGTVRRRPPGHRRLLRAAGRGVAKGLLVLLIWLVRRREFDGIIDGMVYAGIVAAGFAFTENIQYLGMAYADGGDQALTGTFIARCLFTPFAHPMFTVLTGIGIGIAATTRNGALRVLAPIGGFVLAAMSHALWNLGAVTAGNGMLAVYILVGVPIFIAFVALVVWARRREGRVIGQYLTPYADAGG